MPDNPSYPIDKERIVVIPYSEVPDNGRLVINDGFPDPRLAPVEKLMSEMRRISKLSSNRKFRMYGGSQGNKHLRQTLATKLSESRGLPITPENILVTRGATMGIYLAASVLTVPGDEIIVGEPSYPGANEVFRQLGLTLNRIPVDEEGIDTTEIERICKKKNIKFIYAIPHHHHPTTVTLPPKRRTQLLQLALNYNFAILEDDYDYDFHYASQPLMPMASLDQHGSVVYIGTLTKTLVPSIRIGFMAAPKNFIKHATYIRKAVDFQGDSLLELAIAELYNDGTISRHIKKSVKVYRERRNHFCALLQKELGKFVTFKKPNGGMSVWVEFNKDIDLKKLSYKAGKKGLKLNDGTEFETPEKQYNAIRMGFACLNLEEQKEAIAILKSCLFVTNKG